MKGHEVFWFHTSTVDAEVFDEFRCRYFVVEQDRVLEILIKRLVDDVSNEFCNPPFGDEVSGVVVEDQFVCCLHSIADNGRGIILDVRVVSIRTCGDGEGGTPRSRVGSGGLDEADKVIRAVVVVVKLV